MTESSVTTKTLIPWRSIVQISEDIMGVPAITALWYASSILKDHLTEAKHYSRPITGFIVPEEQEEKPAGAIKAAENVGSTALKAVRDVLVSVAGAVKDIASAALPKPESKTGAVLPKK